MAKASFWVSMPAAFVGQKPVSMFLAALFQWLTPVSGFKFLCLRRLMGYARFWVSRFNFVEGFAVLTTLFQWLKPFLSFRFLWLRRFSLRGFYG